MGFFDCLCKWMGGWSFKDSCSLYAFYLKTFHPTTYYTFACMRASCTNLMLRVKLLADKYKND